MKFDAFLRQVYSFFERVFSDVSKDVSSESKEDLLGFFKKERQAIKKEMTEITQQIEDIKKRYPKMAFLKAVEMTLKDQEKLAKLALKQQLLKKENRFESAKLEELEKFLFRCIDQWNNMSLTLPKGEGYSSVLIWSLADMLTLTDPNRPKDIFAMSRGLEKLQRENFECDQRVGIANEVLKHLSVKDKHGLPVIVDDLTCVDYPTYQTKKNLKTRKSSSDIMSDTDIEAAQLYSQGSSPRDNSGRFLEPLAPRNPIMIPG